MINPFEQFNAHKKIPESLKDRVMNTITLAHLLGEFCELFTTKMGKTASHLIDTTNVRRKIKKNDSK